MPLKLKHARSRSLESPAADPGLWPLASDMVFLNHGSFGSCPLRVLEYQQEIRARLERQPIQFFVRELEELLDGARHELAQFVGAAPEDLVFVPNATSGVNTVLHSLSLKARDELLVTDHEYNACRNALDYVAERSGARVVVARVPFPLRSPEEITEAVLGHLSKRTKLALLDHITSPTGLVLPVEQLVRTLSRHGVETLIDGAHAPGMVALNLKRLGATYYTGNCHKWLCAPKGAGFLVVQRNRQKWIRPLAISHGANSPRRDRSRFLLEFGWTGTGDPSAFLSVPTALRFMGQLLPGGWPEIMRHNRALALAGRRVLCRALRIAAPSPDSLIGALAAMPISDSSDRQPPRSPLYTDPLQEHLWSAHRIEVPIMPWPKPPHRLMRISAQLYNSIPQYENLVEKLRPLLPG